VNTIAMVHAFSAHASDIVIKKNDGWGAAFPAAIHPNIFFYKLT
jgi:hypothetical protein